MTMFTLDDLDELEPGLGGKICTLLYEPHDRSSFFGAVEEIEIRLKENRVTADEVIINKGSADGLTLKDALQYASHVHRLAADRSDQEKFQT